MEVINSFFNNIKSKLTNPFFGTLILVLLFQHWELWFAVFNFDEDCMLTDRIYFIQNYILQNITLGSFVIDILKATGIMLVGYLMIVITRSLVIFIENKIMPYIWKTIVGNSVVKKSTHDEVVEERDVNFKKYEEQRDKVLEYSKLIDDQQAQIKEKDENILSLNDKYQDISTQLYSKENKFNKVDSLLREANLKNKNAEEKIKKIYKTEENLIKSRNALYKTIENFRELFLGTENEEFYNSVNKFPPVVIDKTRELIVEKRWVDFLSLSNTVKYNGISFGTDMESEMINRGLMFENFNNSGISLTPIGSLIFKYKEVLKDVK